MIAVVAAIFLARRFHGARTKRMSTGSVYPKVAYLYDPNTNGGGSGGDTEAALMSGAAEGKSQDGAPQAMNHPPRHSTGNTNFNDPANPFRDPADATRNSANSLPAPTDPAMALSAAVAGYTKSSRHTKYPSNGSNPFRSLIVTSPKSRSPPFSPNDVGKRHSTSSTRGEYARLAVNPNTYPNPAAAYWPPLSPYGAPPYGASPYGRPLSRTSTRTSDSDPFQHDILLQVDTRTETPDSVTIFASSPPLNTPRTPRDRVGPKLPVNINGNVKPRGAGSPDLLSPVAAQYRQPQQITITRKAVGSPRTPPTPSEYTPNNTSTLR